jgi:serine/threonine-protein kinase
MGVVYLALRKADGNPVALKTITPATGGTQPEIDRFLREARILSQLDHPHIIAFRDMGHANGRLYFAMDYVRGTDAAQLLKKHGGPLPIGRAVGLVCQLLDALAYAHARGFVHRDLKPANLLVTKSEGRELAKLVDFGLARVYQASRLSGLTLKGELGGTPAFLAPEQITKFREAKPPADQYAAGATLYNLLTNQFIYDLPPRVPEQIAAILQKKPVPIQKRRPDIPKELADIVHRSLAREPKARFPDVGVMRKALLVGG